MYQQDIFIEQTITRQTNTGAKVLSYISLALTIVSVLLTPFTAGLFLVPAVLFGVLTWWEFQNLKIEFDYNLTNGIIDIARVKAGKKRKLLVSIETEDILVMAPTHSDPVQPYVGNGMKTVDALSHTPEANYYVMIVKNKETGNDLKVLWEPNKEILDALHRRDPYKIHLAK